MLSITLIKLLFSCCPWPSKFVGTATVGTATVLTGAPQRDGKLIETVPNGCFCTSQSATSYITSTFLPLYQQLDKR